MTGTGARSTDGIKMFLAYPLPFLNFEKHENILSKKF